nr:Zinc knuckle family protein [Ipomoea batatas]
MHHGGDLVLTPRLSYKNGIVEYFDHFNCDEGSILDLRRMVKRLRFCDKKVQFWYKYGNTRRPKAMKLSSDADILGLITDVPENKELDIFVEHLYDDQWDYDVEIDRDLGDDTLMHDASEGEDDSSGSVGEEFVEVEGVDVRDTATSSHGQGLDGLGKQGEEFLEVECNLSEQVLRSLGDSDSDGEVNGPVNVFEERNLKKEGFKFVTGIVFNSAREFKWAVEYHEALRQKDVKFKKNEARRVRAVCRHDNICKWSIFGSRSNPNCPFTIKTYNSVHSCGNQDENKVVTSGFLAKFYKDEFRVQQPHSHVPQQPQSQVEENHEVQGQFQDVEVETQVPDFVLNEMEGMSSQPSQAIGGNNVIPSVSNFISTATTDAANEPTSTGKKYLTVGGIRYSYSHAYFIRK